MRAGVIDIGSSSIKLLIGEKDGDNIKILESLKNVIFLGKHSFFTERIPQETINLTITILEKYKQVLKEYEVENVMVIATTAVREALNKDIFIDTILRKTELPIDILTVGDIVYYIASYLSDKLKNTYPINAKNLLIAELGSGSLDFSVVKKGFTYMTMGYPLGTLRLRQFMNKLDGSISEISGAVEEIIEHEFINLKSSIANAELDDVILIDENYASYLKRILGKVEQELGFLKCEASAVQELLTQLDDRTTEEIARSFKIPADVAEGMVVYARILNNFFSLTEHTYIYILETSLAEAILANILLDLELSDKYNKTNQLISTATYLCAKYNVDLRHTQYVANLSKVLFDSLKAHLGLRRDDLLYLTLAAYLHDIGMFVHNRSHHKHSEYIINSLNLGRLTEIELRIIACIARYHRKAPPSLSHPFYASLPMEKQILVQKLSALLRIANSLDQSHRQKVKKLEVKFTRNDDVVLAVSCEGDFLLEKVDFAEKKALFEEITGNKISLTIQN